MNITELKTGTKLELEPFNDAGMRAEYSLVSQLERTQGGNTAMIAAPIREGVIFPLRIDTVINVYFALKIGNDYDLFRFKARVTGRETAENIALLRIKVESEIFRIQRRQYYRLFCSLPVQYRPVDSMNAAYNEDIPFRKTIACDLSGGGVCLLLEDRISAGKLIECHVSTGEDKDIRFFGKVVRYDKNEVEGKFKYKAGVAFVKINDSDREAVVKYIFSEQRKLRKKGLI